MKIQLPKTNAKNLFLVALSVTLLSAIPYFAGSGLDNPEPIGSFLNGVFPDKSAAGEPYVSAFPNLRFDSPLTFTTVPNSNKLIVGQRDGKIYWFENDNAVVDKNLLADLSNEVGVVWDGGFLGLSVHPEFGTTGKNYFYLFYTTRDRNGNNYPNGFISGFGCYREDFWGNYLILKRIEVNPTNLTIIPGSDLEMMKMRMFSSTHRGGGITFGNDGYLYIPTGDQSAYSKSQITSTNLDGGVLRIDVDMDPSKSHAPIRTMPSGGRFDDEISGVGYWIPNDNPLLSPNGERFEEFYSVGHRNPHRMTKDRATGIMYIGEIGEGTHEEINVIKPGRNYGWPVYEGNTFTNRNCIGMLDGMPHERPLVAFPRSEANAIIGGYVYRGAAMPDYFGKYICADYGSGEEIWAVDINTGQYDLITQFSPTNIISFGEDNNGELYLLSQGNNVQLYKLRQNGELEGSVPNLLSETGAFEDLQSLQPSGGVIPYELIESFWSDNAEKKRWMAIPNNGSHNTVNEQISFSENGDWQFPVGSVLIKHFELPINENNPTITKRLETRFSIKTTSGSFYYLTYKWNDSQTDAELLESGLNEDIQITKADGSTELQTWTYPSSADCISCHNPATGGTLGPRTRYLNSDYTYNKTGRTANQLVTLSHLGIINATIDDAATENFQTYKTLDDDTASLDEKARSYLDLNCAYCHRPGGTGERALFDLRLYNSLAQTKLLTVGTNTPIGIDGEKIVTAGDASKSILFHRTNSTDPLIAMPPIAKNVVDENAVNLISEWINQLEPVPIDPKINPSTYTITNVGSGKVMDINGVSQDNYADVIQWENLGASNQQFIVEPVDDMYYTIKAVHSNKNIDVEGRGQAPGTNVIQFEDNNTIAQEFIFEYVDNNQYLIKSAANGLYLGIQNKDNTNGSSVKTYAFDGSDHFKWTFLDLINIPVSGVLVTPESAEVITGNEISLTAFILPANATEKSVTWSSSDSAVASVDTEGKVTTLKEGEVKITATTNDGGFKSVSSITVKDEVITATNVTVTPETLTLIEGDTGQLTATVIPSNATNTDIIWSSSDEAIATVDANGLISAVSVGTATITVTTNDGNFTATTAITVEAGVILVTGISISQETVSLTEGEIQQLTATVVPSDATNSDIIWSSSNEAIATIDTNGVVTAISAGDAIITVTTTDGNFTDSTVVTVLEAVVPPSNVTVQTAPNPADDKLYAVFNSEEPLVMTTLNIYDLDNNLIKTFDDPASILRSGGNYRMFIDDIPVGTYILEGVTTIGSYTTEILIAREIVAVTGITLSPEVSVGIGQSLELEVSVAPEDATDNSVVWSTSDANIATVDANGVVTGISPGSVTITATTNDGGFEANSVLTVTEEVVPPSNVTVQTAPNPADDKLYAVFNSEGPLVMTTLNIYDLDNNLIKTFDDPASILRSGGNYRMFIDDIPVGTYILEGVSTTGSYTTQIIIAREVEIVPVTGISLSPVVSVGIGQSLELEVVVAPEDATDNSVVWSTSDANIATVDTNGVVTGVSPGSVTITATTNDGGFEAGATLDVTSIVPVTGITLDETYKIIRLGKGSTLTASVSPENATDKSIVWSSSDTSIATVNQDGVVIGVAIGNTTITARTNDGDFIALAEVDIEDIVMLIAPNPASSKIYVYFSSSNPLDITELILYDALGRQVMVFNDPASLLSGSNYRLIIEGLPAGRYILEAITNQGDLQKQVIIE